MHHNDPGRPKNAGAALREHAAVPGASGVVRLVPVDLAVRGNECLVRGGAAGRRSQNFYCHRKREDNVMQQPSEFAWVPIEDAHPELKAVSASVGRTPRFESIEAPKPPPPLETPLSSTTGSFLSLALAKVENDEVSR